MLVCLLRLTFRIGLLARLSRRAYLRLILILGRLFDHNFGECVGGVLTFSAAHHLQRRCADSGAARSA